MEIDLLHFFLPNIFVLQLLMLCKRMNAICLWSINLAGDRNARVKSIRLVIVTKYGVSTRNAYRSDHINTNRSITIYSSSTTEFNVNGETIGQPIKPTHRHKSIVVHHSLIKRVWTCRSHAQTIPTTFHMQIAKIIKTNLHPSNWITILNYSADRQTDRQYKLNLRSNCFMLYSIRKLYIDSPFWILMIVLSIIMCC